MKRGHRRPSFKKVEPPTTETSLRRSEKIIICIQVLHNEIARALSEYPESEWVFGRLFLLGLLNQSQYDVALRIDGALRRYRSLLAPHGQVKGWRPESLRNCQEDLSPAAQNRMLKAQKEYEEMYGTLKRCGPTVVSTIFGMLERDAVGDIQHVWRGLNAVLLGD